MEKRKFRPSKERPLVRQVFDELLRLIIRLELPPFYKLSEASVSKMLGVSRTPAREALAMLAERNFVDVLPQRGSHVSPVRISDMERSQFMREAIELALVKRVCALNDRAELVEALRKEIELERTYAQFKDGEGFYNSDNNFHCIIAEYAGRRDILPEVKRLKDHMDRFRHIMVASEEELPIVLEQHTQLVDAIEKGDGELAQEIMLVHLRRIFVYLKTAQTEFPQYFDPEELEEAQ